jgi:type III restriction enzyme
VLPKKQVTFTFENFDLASLRYHQHEAYRGRPHHRGSSYPVANLSCPYPLDDPRETRAEDYLVRYLIERNEIDYDAHAALLYKLAGTGGRARALLSRRRDPKWRMCCCATVASLPTSFSRK